MSHLEEALPMYTVRPVMVADNQPAQVVPTMPPHSLFFALGRLPTWAAPPQPPQYERLPSSEDGVELKDVLPSPAAPGGAPATAVVLTPLAAADSAGPTTPAPAPASHSCAAEAVYNAVYYLRMLIYLMLVGAAISTVASLFGYALSLVAVLGWVSPTNRLPPDAGFTACAAGGPIVGAFVGLGGWLHLCTLHLLAFRAASRSELPTFQRLRAAHASENAPGSDEPLYVMAGAALASVLALAVGLTVLPALAALAHEVGFSVGLALGVGVWGATVPFVPALVGAVFTTLSDCNPAAGAECACCCWLSPYY
ncbi:hypothetical protein TRAPUB_6221 [Trametes pubescens]|uniref:Uncharacterized protein n=1 Tax=Trametes pubescens TaxID=154538 RepID=A0A1M2V6L2_TRAPU|nr:hypothetical protein TRAPUB_6221 [Trametes pubescens]